jgi:hypothetical protein
LAFNGRGRVWTLISDNRGAIGGDKQWFTIDKTCGPGHGFQYQAFDQSNCAGGLFNRSPNAGITWETPINIPNEPIFGTLDVDSNGKSLRGWRRVRFSMRAFEQCAIWEPDTGV